MVWPQQELIFIKMKLILEMNNTDGYTYAYPSYHAFECESKEKAELELLEKVENSRNKDSDVNFYGHIFYWSGFYDRKEILGKKSGRIKEVKWIYNDPPIYTLNELFEKLKA